MERKRSLVEKLIICALVCATFLSTRPSGDRCQGGNALTSNYGLKNQGPHLSRARFYLRSILIDI